MDYSPNLKSQKIIIKSKKHGEESKSVFSHMYMQVRRKVIKNLNHKNNNNNNN